MGKQGEMGRQVPADGRGNPWRCWDCAGRLRAGRGGRGVGRRRRVRTALLGIDYPGERRYALGEGIECVPLGMVGELAGLA
jgi:hypothetical protein